MRSAAKVAAMVGVVLLGAHAGTAQAQDAVDWTGPYVGAQANLLAEKSLEQGWFPDTLLGDMGGGAGVFAGFNYQLNDHFVVGVEGEANFDSTTLQLLGQNFLSSNWDGAVKARLGMPVGPNVLAYGTLGYAWGNFDYDPSVVPSGGNFTVGGAQFGIGAEALLTSNIIGRLEATYVHYDTNSVTLGSSTLESTPSMIAVKAGVGFKF
ncbi:MAG TPA: porin family protein [Devosiaceae bacterium]|nr:porin family protein [Devosiaceae bacterium]